MKIHIFQLLKRTLRLFAFSFILSLIILPSELKSQEISTVSEIYNYEIGDTFHIKYSRTYSNNAPSFHQSIKIIILDKHYSQNNDSLFYVREVIERLLFYPNGYTFKHYTDTIFYSNLDSLINMGQIDTVYSGTDYNGRIVNEDEYWGSGSENDPAYLHQLFVKGCGLAYKKKETDNGVVTVYENTILVYYKKGEEIWGTPISFDEPSTVGEIYNFEIGDIFHIEKTHNDDMGSYNFKQKLNITIIDKYFTQNNDSLFYVRDVRRNIDNNYLHYIDTIIYSNLNSLINMGQIDIIYSGADYNGRIVNEDEYWGSGVSSDPAYLYQVFVNGCGLVYKWSVTGSTGRYDHRFVTLEYYKKGDEEWGTPISIVEPSTIGEIYNFEIGDIFHYSDSSSTDNIWEYTISNIEIIDKYYSNSLDSLSYVRDFAVQTKIVNDLNWSFSFYTDTVTYTKLDSYIHAGNIDSVYTNIDLYNNRIINRDQTWGDGYESLKYQKLKFVKGCGLAHEHKIYYGNTSIDTIFITLVYFNKSGEEWGIENVVAISEQNIKPSSIYVYPNPAKNIVNIASTDILIERVKIFSLTGKLVKSVYSNSKITTVDISELGAGMYIIKVISGDMLISKKLILK